MQKNISFEKIYYELAILINKELYDEKIISANLYKNTETELLRKLDK